MLAFGPINLLLNQSTQLLSFWATDRQSINLPNQLTDLLAFNLINLLPNQLPDLLAFYLINLLPSQATDPLTFSPTDVLASQPTRC